jgi:tellurite resistance-related uncharacterized protein
MSRLRLSLPPNLAPYRRTDTFNEHAVHKRLLREHATKPLTCGLTHVLEGRLRYRITDPRPPADDLALSPDTAPSEVEPTILHEVDPPSDRGGRW